MTATPNVDERAVKAIASNVYFADLGEERVRRVAEACERVESAQLVNGGRWLNPATRIEILRILKPELRQISETHAWMVARRYRDLKRFYVEEARLAEEKKKEEEAKAKLAAAKAAKAAAAKAAAPAPAPATPAPGPSTTPQPDGPAKPKT